MSPLIIDILVGYANSNQCPLMIIASRNQIDHDGGYVMPTGNFSKYIEKSKSKYIKICRDHCGPYFLDSEKNMSLSEAMENTKKTIAADIENNFELIHIDTSRCENPYQAAEQLIKFALSLNNKVEFEFGSEENTGTLSNIEHYKKDINFAKQFPNMQFVVVQTGSLVMEDKQIGTFNYNMLKELTTYANKYNIRLKEHNADYFTVEQLQLRKLCGIHALNIAPQLGVEQTKTLIGLSKKLNLSIEKFQDVVIKSEKWKKWIISKNDYHTKLIIAGHYLSNTPEYIKISSKIPDYEHHVYNNITRILNHYYGIFCK